MGKKTMYDDLTPQEFVRQRVDEPGWQLLDVREGWERDVASVDGTLNIPMGEVAERLTELDADRPIAVLCHSGGRSARIAAFLSQHGFGKVANIAGGIDAWSLQVDDSIARY